MAETWHDITLDSYIVDIRRVKKTKEHGYAKGVAEVCKYALKFSDLSMENTFHAFLTLKGKRLTGSFGSMHGLKIEKAVPDEISKDDLPYGNDLSFCLWPEILLQPRNNKRRKAEQKLK